jgi:hypothetical protein
VRRHDNDEAPWIRWLDRVVQQSTSQLCLIRGFVQSVKIKTIFRLIFPFVFVPHHSGMRSCFTLGAIQTNDRITSKYDSPATQILASFSVIFHRWKTLPPIARLFTEACRLGRLSISKSGSDFHARMADCLFIFASSFRGLLFLIFPTKSSLVYTADFCLARPSHETYRFHIQKAVFPPELSEKATFPRRTPKSRRSRRLQERR